MTERVTDTRLTAQEDEVMDRALRRSAKRADKGGNMTRYWTLSLVVYTYGRLGLFWTSLGKGRRQLDFGKFAIRFEYLEFNKP